MNNKGEVNKRVSHKRDKNVNESNKDSVMLILWLDLKILSALNI